MNSHLQYSENKCLPDIDEQMMIDYKQKEKNRFFLNNSFDYENSINIDVLSQRRRKKKSRKKMCQFYRQLVLLTFFT